MPTDEVPDLIASAGRRTLHANKAPAAREAQDRAVMFEPENGVIAYPSGQFYQSPAAAGPAHAPKSRRETLVPAVFLFNFTASASPERHEEICRVHLTPPHP
jgi:hypothetical protein